MTAKPILVFVSPRFLFPADSGGKIRTSQILRGLKGGAFQVRLAMPCSEEDLERYADEINSVCDEIVYWREKRQNRPMRAAMSLFWSFARNPIPVMKDWSRAARKIISRELDQDPDIIVFDFPHSAVLAPDNIDCPSVLFTHNIESEIFRRHSEVAKSPFLKWLWSSQYRKMLAYERRVLRTFDMTVAVSDRDCRFFRDEYGVCDCSAIPTGVDTEFFAWEPPLEERQVVFCGSMDWLANIDAIEFFYADVWPLIIKEEPGAQMKVVGRTPPESMVRKISGRSPEWTFTGFVDDVRQHVAGAAVFVIPLRVGGGTRIKAFEAMAMGCPVVSTSIGVEGLPVQDGIHYLNADSAGEFANCVTSLLRDGGERHRISKTARELVDANFGFRQAASVFEDICLRTVDRYLR